MDNPKTFLALAGATLVTVAGAVTYLQHRKKISDFIDNTLKPESESKESPIIDVDYQQNVESIPYTPEVKEVSESPKQETVAQSFDFSQSKSAEYKLFDQLEALKSGPLGESGVDGFGLVENDDGTIDVTYKDNKGDSDAQTGHAAADGFGTIWQGESLSLLDDPDIENGTDFYEKTQEGTVDRIQRYARG